MFLYIENLFLPVLEHCRLSFLQRILAEDKLVFEKDEIRGSCPSKQYDEFAVKNVWNKVRSHKRLCRYLPSEEMDAGRYFLISSYSGVPH